MLLVIHYSIGDVQDSQGVPASEMTYIVSGGALNSTHLLQHGGGNSCYQNDVTVIPGSLVLSV